MADRRVDPDPAVAVLSEPARIAEPVADLLASPNGPRDRQMLFGETVTRLGFADGFAYIRAEKDGYHGFVAPDHLGPVQQATHKVTTLATHVYRSADIKSPDRMTLSFGAPIRVIERHDTFVEIEHGFVPTQHIGALDATNSDSVDVAALFLGTPYLWGGNSRLGIDCSGLVQAALLACGIACPGDSDLQMNAFPALPDGTAPQRGDLLFWKGHVALVADPDTILHANAHAMATVYENLTEARARIERSGDGPVLKHVRPKRSYSRNRKT